MPRKIFVCGHNGMVGSAIARQLKQDANKQLITKSRTELDLLDQAAVSHFFENHKVDEVCLSAARVGGIHANSQYPAEFIYENLVVQTNVVHAAYQAGVKKLLFLGSSCIYPKHAEQPMDEAALLSGALEPTNEPYAIAKIAGIKLCESYNRQYGVDYRSVMPTNLYGPGDNFHDKNSHVIPAMMRRLHLAKAQQLPEVVIWGSGKPRREFLHVDELAQACEFVMDLEPARFNQRQSERISHINVGTGQDCTIAELAQTMQEVVGFDGQLVYDSTKPDGAPQKLLNVSKLSRLGWQASIELKEGLQQTYDWFLEHEDQLRGIR